MMWHFYEIPYIPDLELVKYQSLGEQGIDGILERHNRFLRQWQRNTVLIHTTLHFFLSYTHERPKGSRLQIFLAFSSDQTVNFESMKKQQTKAASTLCIGPDTFITPNQSTTTKLVSGSHSPQKRETKMPKKFCAII